jgi:hypothetical protein
MLEARDVALWHALFGRAGRHAGCQFMEPKRASLLFACREIQAGYVPAATMNFNARQRRQVGSSGHPATPVYFSLTKSAQF